jgi:hypothetical protein
MTPYSIVVEPTLHIHPTFMGQTLASRAFWGDSAVAIYRMLKGMVFDEREVKAMTSAYEAILVELQLTDRTDPLTESIASKIIVHCQTGICDPERLCELTLREIRGQ